MRLSLSSQSGEKKVPFKIDRVQEAIYPDLNNLSFLYSEYIDTNQKLHQLYQKVNPLLIFT
jgi:hypothetical protein